MITDPIDLMRAVKELRERFYSHALLFNIFFIGTLLGAFDYREKPSELMLGHIVAENMLNRDPAAGDFQLALRYSQLSRSALIKDESKELQGYIDFTAIFWATSKSIGVNTNTLALEGWLSRWFQFALLNDEVKLQAKQHVISHAANLTPILQGSLVAVSAIADYLVACMSGSPSEADYLSGLHMAHDTLLLYTTFLHQFRIQAA